MTTESKGYLISRLDEEWPKFKEMLDAIPDSDMEIPGVIDEWCLKELLGHVVFWARKGAGDVTLATAGKHDEIELPGNQQRVDAWNAAAAAEGNTLSAEALRTDLEQANQAAREALEKTTDAALAVELGGWTVGVRFAEDTYRHYREHAEQIRAWQRQLETTEA
jgi:hypothetical protein